jgi:hypothetical protein
MSDGEPLSIHRGMPEMSIQIASALVGGAIAVAGVIIGALITHWLTLRRTKEQRKFDQLRNRRDWLLEELRKAVQSDDDEAKVVTKLLREGGVILQPAPPGESYESSPSRIARSDVAFACVPHDSKVLMADGSARPVYEVADGDEILTYDARAHATVSEPVAAVVRGAAEAYVVINDSIKVTPRQKILCEGRYVEARRLQLGQRLVNEAHRPVAISSLKYSTSESNEPVFSIILRSADGYYVRIGDADHSIVIKEGDTGKNGL